MSLTINGATNTLTAASGLTIAGNTAVTGTLSATGKISTSSSAGGRVISAENDTNTNQTQMQVSNTNGRYEAGVLTSGHAYAGSITVGASFHLYAGNTDVAQLSSTGLAVTGALSFGEGGGGGFLGVPIDTGYMRIHGSNAINQGAGVILFGTTSAAPNTGRLTAAVSTVVQWTSTGAAVTGTLSATGVTSVTDATDATSTTAASLKTAGGLAVAASAYFGGRVNSALFRTTSGQVVCTATVQSGDLYTISRGAIFFDINCFATGAALQTTALISSDGTNHTLTILKSGASTVLAIVGNAIRVTCASNVTLDWNALRIA